MWISKISRGKNVWTGLRLSVLIIIIKPMCANLAYIGWFYRLTVVILSLFRIPFKSGGRRVKKQITERHHIKCNAIWKRLVKLQYAVLRRSTAKLLIMTAVLYIGWQWRNVFIRIYASCSGGHDVWQGNVNILQHLQSDRQSGASVKVFLNPMI